MRRAPIRFASSLPIAFAIGLISALLVPTPAWADFSEGKRAYQEGDFARALKLARTAALAEGDAEAATYLGLMYFLGKGVGHDHQKAAEWYLLAANRGHMQAQINLGTLYATGDGVREDLVEALKWFTLAARKKSVLAEQNRLLARRKMTPGQIARAEREAEKWLASERK